MNVCKTHLSLSYLAILIFKPLDNPAQVTQNATQHHQQQRDVRALPSRHARASLRHQNPRNTDRPPFRHTQPPPRHTEMPPVYLPPPCPYPPPPFPPPSFPLYPPPPSFFNPSFSSPFWPPNSVPFSDFTAPPPPPPPPQ